MSDRMGEGGLFPQVYQLMKYKYYDTPEGEDCFKKMFYTTKYASLVGSIIAGYDIALYNQLHGVLPILSRVGYWVGPYALMGMSFTALPCALQAFRNKNDYWNNGIGGLITGMIMGAMRKSHTVGAVYGFSLSFIAVFWHISEDYEWRKEDRLQEDRFGKWKREYGSHDHWKMDWTFTEDPRDRKLK